MSVTFHPLCVSYHKDLDDDHVDDDVMEMFSGTMLDRRPIRIACQINFN